MFFNSELDYSIGVEHTSEQYRHFGRRLYQLKQQQQTYWLKYQRQDVDSVVHIVGWQQEYAFYQYFSRADFILPHQMIDLSQLQGINDDMGSGLILPDRNLYFLSPPKDIADAYTRIRKAYLLLFKLHTFGWVHGDLKPQHFLSDDESLYLIDFEHSFKIGETVSHIHATPRYMAPELFHGQNKSRLSDFYALGVVLYQWLTQSKLQAASYYDWAILHCQQPFNVLNTPYACLDYLISPLLTKQACMREQQLQELKSILNQDIALV